MELIANRVNGTCLRDILPGSDNAESVDTVLAAIAYGSNASNQPEDLIGNSLKNKFRLDLWMRYDETVPVSVPMLERLLVHQKDNIFTKFVPDCFHAKVIWWKGYGAYIGSANHTDRAWLTNIEVGVFLTDDELVLNNLDTQLDDFFGHLQELDVAIPISNDYISEMRVFAALNRKIPKIPRKRPIWNGPSFVSKVAAFDKRKESFEIEWRSTLGILKGIEDELGRYRPAWIKEDVPSGWQVDQFLHAYYYNKVGEGLRKPFEEYFLQNFKDPASELKKQLEWWSKTPSAPSYEDQTFYKSAPLIKDFLSQERILSLTTDEFEQVCRNTHATSDHVIKIPLSYLGRPDLKTLNTSERFKLFIPILLSNTNQKGWNILELLHYVLYEGKDIDIWERIYNAGRDKDYMIPRYGLNSIAEVVGWARPKVVPPRNGRTSKALRSLGYDVKIY